MKEYIEREKAIEAFDDPSVERYYGDVDPDSVIRVIERIPAADVRPVVRGKWERKRYGPWASRLKCSECEILFDIATDSPSWNFCPNCGADMREES